MGSSGSAGFRVVPLLLLPLLLLCEARPFHVSQEACFDSLEAPTALLLLFYTWHAT